MSKRGTYIVIEGIDGSGKTTQYDNILKVLGENAIGVREPGGTPMSEHIRTILKDKNIPRSGATNMFLFAASRSDLIDSVVRPAINKGAHVLSDRNWLSTFAYQSAEGVDTAHIWQLNQLAAAEFFEPDLLLLIDVDPEICRQRLAGRPGAEADYFDLKGKDYFDRVRSAYIEGTHKLANSVVVDGSGTPEEVWGTIQKIIKERGIV